MNKRKVGASTLVMLLVVFTWYLQSEQEENTGMASVLDEARSLNADIYNGLRTDLTDSEISAGSLEGVSHQINFELNETNSLIPSYAIREMFDHYLSTLGELELEVILAQIRAEIEKGLPEPARTEALGLLKRYVDFKIALAEFQLTEKPVVSLNRDMYEMLLEQQQRVIELRREYFSEAEYTNFFELEDAQSSFLLAQLRINSDAELSESEKQKQLGELARTLPAELAESRESAQAHASLRENVHVLRAKGGSDEAVFQLRSAELGVAAATALAELDQDRAVWQSRLDSFSQKRSSVLNSGLSSADQESAIDQLLASQFNTTEQKRVRALMQDGRFD